MIVHCGGGHFLLGQPAAYIGRLAARIIEPTPHHLLCADDTPIDLDLRRSRIGACQTAGNAGNLVGGRQVTLGEQQTVRHRHLAYGLEVTTELATGMGDIDRRDHPVHAKAFGNEEIFEQGVEHRRRIGQAGGFDENTRESRDLAPQATHEQVAQAARHLPAYAAAQTTRADNDNIVVHPVDQVVVYGDVAQFVDQDGGIGECWLSQQVVEQRGLAGPQKTGKDGHRNGPLGVWYTHGSGLARAVSRAAPYRWRVRCGCFASPARSGPP